MSAEEDMTPEEPAKKSKLPLIVGIVLALVLGGGGFFAVYSGLILAPSDVAQAKHDAPRDPASDSVAFVALDPLIIALAPDIGPRHLRIAAQLEVPPTAKEDVAHLSPRILDVMNGYLRAIDLSDIEDPTALMRLRAQLLRRIQIVTGDGRVNDFLITEFVLN
ncbi:flagellar basal body-associated FliL family protein [Actibacterium ureilyticum]|uniref:flagellar basal body-associated FliL family protein n=1 Tax=Actibacterium ureilyticum TaxID=1590614 RepID=UPI000BAB229D|nr:flagellar basal body-associated FliL family protein [Actibacterium ureilyticum]